MQFTIRISPFLYSVGIDIGEWNQERIQALANRIDPESQVLEKYSCAGCCYTLKGGSVIWIDGELSECKRIGTLSHEAFHASINLADHIGAKLDNNSEEFYAHIIDYIVTETLRKVGTK